jgi:hypothetical protein
VAGRGAPIGPKSRRRDGALFQGSSTSSSSAGNRTLRTALRLRLADNVVHARRKSEQRGQERPLIFMRAKALVDEKAVALLPRLMLERKSDQISEPAKRHHILARKEAIVRREADLRTSLHVMSSAPS